MSPRRVSRLALAAALAVSSCGGPARAGRAAQQAPRNLVVILSDDHRYDFMGFMDEAPGFLETPGLDRMAAEGAHVANAFVTTSLCSPSRASILSGLYTHDHGVVDNQSELRPGVTLFPQMLREAGYRTAFIGKWHMGEHTDDPQPGFDRWVSFPGQGVYHDPTFNIDGERRQEEGYITDLLTDHAIVWLEESTGRGGADDVGGAGVRGDGAGDAADSQAARIAQDTPFLLYLSHKAVHAEFEPAERHRGRYADLDPPYPPSMADTEESYEGKPRWVREQRSSWHGVDYLYHGQMELDEFYRSYAETLLALDESVGRLLDWLEENGLAESTLVLYLGDNGFLLGEHGLIDKRHAYEESMRIPMLAWAPGLIEPGTRIEEVVLNVDVAPTLLAAADIAAPAEMDGRSFLPLLAGEPAPGWREDFLYVYYWEHPFPHTPTTLALRGDRYKYVFYHGVWDTNELYDLVADPRELRNLIADGAHQERVAALRERLFDLLEAQDAMAIPLRRAGGWQAAERGPP